VCKPGGKGCESCSAQTDCGADDVCTVLSGCTWAAGESYDITIESVTFPEKDAAGAAWDAFGGLPDPKVCVQDDTKVLGCTATKSDTTSAWFFDGNVVTATLWSTSKLCVSVYDVDAVSDDYADGSCWNSWLKLVKSGGYSGYLYKGLVQVGFTIEPSF